ncbi:hypothetical protein [Chitinivorax sp. B]|uniref:hypothetical protein n=1 Tax=Chitinivorax sp. B TaxID=2502235 RepID=UPI0010F9A3BF|nr:hypothetical protein [Chitinivorax sp. B]
MFDIANGLQRQVAVRVVLVAGQQLVAGGSYPLKSIAMIPTIPLAIFYIKALLSPLRFSC